MPSVLVETGFLTNKNEGKYLNSLKGQSEMSVAIADAIDRYFSNKNKEISSYEINSKNDKNKKDEYVFKIRIAVGSKLIPLKSYNFNGLNNLAFKKENGLYKYFYEKTSDYQTALKNLRVCKRKGYKDSFIVLFKNGFKYSLDKYLTEIEK